MSTRVVKTLRNAGKSWTPDDVKTLQRLAAKDKPVRVIALLMGRTAIAVQAKALQEHILLKRQPRKKSANAYSMMAVSIARAAHEQDGCWPGGVADS